MKSRAFHPTTWVCAAVLALTLPFCFGQSTEHKKKAPPKPEPTAPELFEFLRGSLLSYSADDGSHDNLEVSLDPEKNVLTVMQPDGHCDVLLGSLNANTLVWDIIDPSDSTVSRPALLRLTIVSTTGKPARTCYDKQNNVDEETATNRARFLFSQFKTEQMSGFRTKVEKAFKKLIALSGGAEEKDIFKP